MYTLKLNDGKEISGLKWHAGRFWTDEDLRNKLTEKQLSNVTVSTDEDINAVPENEEEAFMVDFFQPGTYKDMAFYDYRKRKGEHGLWAFYIAKKM